MLRKADIDALINAPNLSDAMRMLVEKGFAGATPAELLKNEEEKAWSAAYEVCPEDAPIDILLYEKDFHNLKTVLKAQLAGAAWQDMVLSPSLVEPQVLAKAVREASFSELPDFLFDTAEKAYKLLTTVADGQLAEILIDKAYLAAVYKRSLFEKNDFLIGFAELSATIYNMKAALRCAASQKSADFVKNTLIDLPNTLFDALCAANTREEVFAVILSRFSDADTTSIGAFERWCDNKKLAYVRTAKGQSFGFLPILAFLIGKSYEIQTLRIILSCKENGVGEEVIRERLRDMYV